MNHARLEKLHALMEKDGLGGVVIIPGANLLYLTGAKVFPNERPMMLFVPAKGEACVLLPHLDLNIFSSTGFSAKLFPWKDAEGYQGALAAILKELDLGGHPLGVEGTRMRFFEGEAIRQAAPAWTLRDSDATFSRLRLHKDAAEIAALQQAIRISEQALEQTLREVRVGMTEIQVMNILVNHMNAFGAQGLSFSPIVLAGDNSARPHGNPRGDYHIQRGDPLLFDFGAMYQDYAADITRTFFVGEAAPHFRQIYAAVQAANQAGREAAKVGVSAEAVDLAARQAMIAAGFEGLIIHRTGHGLGLDIHEDPSVSVGNPMVLEAGMVFTIEPGLYEDGAIGVRIEDNVVMRPEGAESLTSFPRGLRVIGN
jgi:Xaa-Pro dipeptidase